MSKIFPRPLVIRKPLPRFESIVVIDNDEIDIFVNQTVIKSVALSKVIKHETNLRTVLEKLQKIERLTDVPELIFLDLNTIIKCETEGFEFLTEFNRLSDFIRNKCKIVIVSASPENHDKHRALMNPSVIRLLKKPLDVCQLRDFIYS